MSLDETNLVHGAKESAKDKIISDKEREIIQVVVYVFLCGLVSIFGIMANVVNVLVFC